MPALFQMSRFWLHILSLAANVGMISCGGNGGDQSGSGISVPINSTSGTISISVDESYQPLVDAELSAFHRFYPDAKILVNYKPEGECIKDLMSKVVTMIIVSRTLNEEEMVRVQKRTIVPKQTRLASDAIAILLNSENEDSLFTLADLKDIFAGKWRYWSDRRENSESKGQPDEITIVFDHERSGTLRFIRENLMSGIKLPPNVFAAGTNDSVISYVSENPNAIGVIGVNWLSDADDESARVSRSKIKMAFVSNEGDGTAGFVQPLQAFIGSQRYPLTRNLYAISAEGFDGLGTGFVNFFAGDKGQRIVLKSGLVPESMPSRQISMPPTVVGSEIEDKIERNKAEIEEKIEFKYD